MTTQAHPPSEAQQLADARIANALLHLRLAEQDKIAAKERARADALEADNDRLRADGVRMANTIGQLEHERDDADTDTSEMTWRANALHAALSRLVRAVEGAGIHVDTGDFVPAMDGARELTRRKDTTK
jgi:uncharacterized protein YlxW (UPF0749 family)